MALRERAPGFSIRGQGDGTVMLRVVIADDEKMARKRLRRLLEALGGVEIVAECRSGEEALTHLDASKVDLAILDIDMPGIDGLETAALAARRGVPVVFVTAHAQHAVAAFDRGAAHYLLKPLEPTKLEEALARVRGEAPSPAPSSPERIVLTVGGDACFVEVSSISHALYDGSLVTVHAGEKSWLSDESLQELEGKLIGGEFVRVHRRALVNLQHVERLRSMPSGGYTAIMKGGGEVPVSRQAARSLRKRLGL